MKPKSYVRKRVPKAYAGLEIGYDDALRRGSARIASHNSPSAVPDFKGQSGGGGGVSAGGVATGAMAAVQGVTEIAGHIKAAGVNRDWLVSQDDDRVAYGAKPNVGKTVGKSALSGAAAGAAIGSVVPGIGTVIGGVVGGVVGAAAGLIGGGKKARKYKRDMLDRQKAVNDRRNQRSALLFNTETYEDGGELQPDKKSEGSSKNDMAVILGGELHDNGGNAIVDAKTKEKLYETEREELLLTFEQSECVEKKIADFDKTGDEKYLIELGKEVSKIIKTQTLDKSGVYA